jgi:hypothetical protein
MRKITVSPITLLLLGLQSFRALGFSSLSPRKNLHRSTPRASRVWVASGPLDLTIQDVVASVAAPNPSTVAEWHRQRRKEMLAKYGDQIGPLERSEASQKLGIPLLCLTCTSLFILAIVSGSLPVWGVVLLAIFPGSVFSLWQLQILHDVIHGSFFEKGKTVLWGIPRHVLQERVLFWGSMPCVFGYYLYLKAGHLTHHSNTGEFSLAEVFASDKNEFEDGDVLFVAHRMNLSGDYGPTIPLPFGKELKMSIRYAYLDSRYWCRI